MPVPSCIVEIAWSGVTVVDRAAPLLRGDVASSLPHTRMLPFVVTVERIDRVIHRTMRAQ